MKKIKKINFDIFKCESINFSFFLPIFNEFEGEILHVDIILLI